MKLNKTYILDKNFFNEANDKSFHKTRNISERLSFIVYKLGFTKTFKY